MTTRVALAAAGFLLGVILLELFLSVWPGWDSKVGARPGSGEGSFLDFPYAPRSDGPREIADGRLGIRGNPGYPGHDRNGFRNWTVPSEAWVVAMGDSQTYGIGVRPGQAWPRQMERMTGLETYSIAMSSWGPPQSLLLMREALRLRPRLIIEAFYTGNDLYDAFDLVYKKNQLPEFRSSNRAVESSIGALEAREPLKDSIEALFAMTRPSPDPKESGTSRWARLRVLSLVKKVGRPRPMPNDVLWERLRRQARGREDHWLLVERGPVRTILTPSYRATAVNLSDPRIVEGRRICLKALLRMSAQARRAKVVFVVLLIPTKELVYKNLVLSDAHAPPEAYRTLIRNEEEIRETMKHVLEREKIATVDALSSLRREVEMGNQPYFISPDGHPNANGHRALARLLVTSGYWKLVTRK